MDIDKFQFKKAYGQNFIKDKNIVINMVEDAEIKDDSLIIEIGPGSGVLTDILITSSKQVLSYEIDTRLKDYLLNKYKDKNVDFIFDDFLKRDIKEDISKYSYSHIYVIANLPYYITTPIVEKLINTNINIDNIVIMVQKEVGDRFNASIGTKEYNSLTVYLQYYFEIKKLFLVSRNSFIPKPNVDSVVISLKRKKELSYLKNSDLFFKLVKDSFRFKRKNLRNNLKDYDLKIIEEVLKKYNLDLTVRAEKISLDLFIEISNALA